MYVEPSRAANQVRIQCENAATTAGNIYWACWNRLQYCNDAIWLDNHLASVSDVSNFTYHFLTEYLVAIVFLFTSWSASYSLKPGYVLCSENISCVW